MNIKTLTLSILLSIFASIAISAQNNIAEEVAWVVGDQLIYKSEIEAMYQQMQYERTPINGDPYCVIPEKIAVEKLFLHQADIDTVEVQNSMIQQQVDSRINYYISNLGSKEKVEQYFRKTIPQMREEMTEMWKLQQRDIEKKNLLKMKLPTVKMLNIN